VIRLFESGSLLVVKDIIFSKPGKLPRGPGTWDETHERELSSADLL